MENGEIINAGVENLLDPADIKYMVEPYFANLKDKYPDNENIPATVEDLAKMLVPYNREEQGDTSAEQFYREQLEGLKEEWGIREELDEAA